MPNDHIERIYHVFSRYRRPVQLEGCPCCTTAKDAEPLLRQPLRAISAAELEHYAFKALTTWGTVSDFKYFLPRILELTDDGQLLCEIEVTLGKLAYGEIQDWPCDEQRAIDEYVTNAWRDSVRAFDVCRADAFLCGAARFLDDVTPLLDIADAVAPEFKSAYASERSDQTKRKLLNSFWEKQSLNYRRVLAWIYPTSSNQG